MSKALLDAAKKVVEARFKRDSWDDLKDAISNLADVIEQPVTQSAINDGGPAFPTNARLIAAAPELLKALKEMTPDMPPENASCHVGIVPQSKCFHCQRIANAKAAIAKAEGISV